MKHSLHWLLCATGSLAALTVATAAQAQSQDAGTASTSAETSAQAATQEPPAEEASSVGDIVVTAQRRAQSINDVPISISAFSGNELAARGVTDASDLSKLVTGFTFADSGFSAPVYTVRGVGFNDGSLAATSTVAVYLDEVPLPYPVMTRGALLDVQRLEVLKGPQGTLYGQNSTGGAVNYIPNSPTRDFAAGGTLDFGRFDAVRAEAYVSGPLSSTLAARISASTQFSDAWQKSLTRPGDRLGKTRRASGRILLDWKPTDRLTATFNLNGWLDRSDTLAPQLYRKLYVRPAAINTTPVLRDAPINPSTPRVADWVPGVDYDRDDRFYQASATVKWELNDYLNVNSITSYSDYKNQANMNRSGVAALVFDTYTDGKIRSIYQELRLAGGSKPFSWIVGGNYRDDKVVENSLYNNYDATNAVVSGVRTRQYRIATKTNVNAWAVFANADWDFAPTLSLNAGARYSGEKQSLTGCVRDDGDGTLAAAFTGQINTTRARLGLAPIPAILPGACITADANLMPNLVHQEQDQKNFSFRTALNWKPNRDVLVYGSISQGYKSGGFSSIVATSASQFAPSTQERLQAFEIGTKLTLFDGKAQLNAAGFYYLYKDKQLRGRRQDNVLGALPAQVNIPKSEVKGLEFDALVQVTEGLRLYGGATYLDTKIKRFIGYNLVNQLEDFAGSPFNYSPKWQANVGGEYSIPVTASAEAFAGGDLTYRSKTNAFFGDAQDYLIKGYTLVDLRVGVRDQDGRWSASIYGRNVGNTYYWSNVTKGNDAIARLPGVPATYGVTLTGKF
ncbi:TonB-dependent receptor [Sphingobium lactosutens]|uniref:TonB-dependent receptor n=1 Tax=Sphingobium lactosutens TaxID=522773 RepID=UPI0015BBBD23|nr:TonB-dependent receptor [Sphingobium lactosutens]NWK95969.1 TonB-dependent receptor [Sphingobium lactosutens]